MTRFLFTILTLFMLTQCTVHKRVHRKGWYVEWHTNKKAANSSCVLPADTTHHIHYNTQRIQQIHQPSNVIKTKAQPAPAANALDIKRSPLPPDTNEVIDKKPNTNTSTANKIKKTYSNRSTQLPERHIKPSRIGLSFTFFGVLLIALGVILLLAASSQMYFTNIIILGLLSLILLAVGIVLLITAVFYSSAKAIKRKTEEKKDQIENESAEEQIARKKRHQEDRKGALIAVLLLGVLGVAYLIIKNN